MGKLADIFNHPDEIIPLAAMYMASKRAKVLPSDADLRFCYGMLNRVSRSFAVVIQQLPTELRDAICVFYLVLRALDTVEDDMSLPNNVKLPLLRCFYEKSHDRQWSMSCGSGNYLDLMQNYPYVTSVFQRLEKKYQQVIENICQRMGNGMADFIVKDVVSIKDYDLYCHYVAGLVGIGLSQLFASSGLEDESFFDAEALANNMGLFLQKTNIIRDYLEDINEEPAPRMFWPKEIWGKYCTALADFKSEDRAMDAVRCLNHMILDALRHVNDCLVYMSKLRHKDIFRFCAIPQVMAMGTLNLCLNNHAVFEGVVKMRRGQTAKIFWTMTNFEDACAMFEHYARQMSLKIQAQAGDDPSVEKLIDVCNGIERVASKYRKENGTEVQTSSDIDSPSLLVRSAMLVLSLLFMGYAWQVPQVREFFGIPNRSYTTSIDLLNRCVAVILLLYTSMLMLTYKRQSIAL